ncbi:response regulator [Cohnella soli]|uniref:Response regulator n=1 Tax=Cohnella soli TaxID=425005 RepID=A0ABW0HT13_9BACL
MNVFILDDDENIVQALYRMIERSGLPLERTLETCSPVDALNIVVEQRPDIIITDIRMPGMTGLEFIEELKRRGSRSKVIFMSGYKEFEYAQEAIRLGAHDYLVKPFSEQRLTAVLTSVIEGIKRERKSKHERETLLKKSLYHSLIKGYQWELADKEQLDGWNMQTKSLFYYLLYIELQIPADGSIERFTDIEAKLRKWEKEVLLPEYHSLLLFDDVRQLALIYSYAGQRQASIHEEHRDVWVGIKQEIECNLGVIANIGVSSILHSVSELPKGFQEAKKASQQMFFAGKPGIHMYDPSDKAEVVSSDLFESAKIVECILLGKHQESTELILSGFARIRQNHHADKQAIFLACNNLIGRLSPILKQTGESSLMENIGTLTELQEWMLQQLALAAMTAEQARKDPDDQLIAKVKQYCLDHIGEDITLQQIAEFAGYNKAYFSSYFKKKAGVSFWDYLTGVRIDKAKELLETSQLNVYEIGQAVGYHNPSHFGKMFKQAVGCTPAEYKLTMAGFGK